MTPNDRVTLARTLQEIERRSDIRFVFVTTSPTQAPTVRFAQQPTHQVRAAFVKRPNRYGPEISPAPPLAIPLPGIRAVLTGGDLRDTMVSSAHGLLSESFSSRVRAAVPFASTYVDTRVSEVLVNHIGVETMAMEAVAQSSVARQAIVQCMLDAGLEAAKTLPKPAPANVVINRPDREGIAGPVIADARQGTPALVNAAPTEPPLLQVERAHYSFALASMSAALEILRTNMLPPVVNLDIPIDMRSGTMRSLDDLLNPETTVLRSDIAQTLHSILSAINEVAREQQTYLAEGDIHRNVAPVLEVVRQVVNETLENATGMNTGIPPEHFSDRAITFTGQPYEYRLIAAGPTELTVDAGAGFQVQMAPINDDDQEWGNNALMHLGT